MEGEVMFKTIFACAYVIVLHKWFYPSCNCNILLILFIDSQRKKTLRSAKRILSASAQENHVAKRSRRAVTIDDRAVLLGNNQNRNAQPAIAPHAKRGPRNAVSSKDDGELASSENRRETQADNIEHAAAQGSKSDAWFQIVSTNTRLTNEVIGLKSALVDAYKSNVDLSQKYADSRDEIRKISKDLFEREKDVENLKTKLKELSDSRFAQDLIDFNNSNQSDSNAENVSATSQVGGANSCNLLSEFDPFTSEKESPKGKPKKVDSLKMLCCAAVKKS